MPLTSRETHALWLCLGAGVLATAALAATLGAQDQDTGIDDPVAAVAPAAPPITRRPRAATRRLPSPRERSVYTGVPGTIVGSIEDQLGTSMPGVTVRISDNAGDGQTVTATAHATFEFSGLRPGSYSLDFAEPGFARTHVDVDVTEGERAARTVVLPIDTRDETLRITPRGARVPPSPRNELERFLANRLVPAVSAASRPCQSGRPCVVPARKTIDRLPVYPPDAVTHGVEGLVYLEARITREGLVEELRLTAEDEALGESAMSAVQGWQFEPARLNGVAVETQMTVTVEFSLK